METTKSLSRFFITTSGAILCLSAAAKLISANGNDGILQQDDPIFSISFRHLFYLAAMIEAIVAAICIFGKKLELQSALVAFLSVNFVIYRFGINWLGFDKSCPCLGTLTGALRISPKTADNLMGVIASVMLIGSYWILLNFRCRRRTLTEASEL